jgi:hypothetical protein
MPAGIGKVAPEFDSPTPARMPFTRLPDGDVYAPEVGFSDGFPVARSPSLHRTWLAHCYVRTDSPAFTALIESRRNRPENFFKVRAGRIDLCNVPIAVREQRPAADHSS